MRRSLRRWANAVGLWKTVPFVAPEQEGSPFYHQFRTIAGRAHLREEFIRERASGKRVLHFGFLDSPFLEEKVDSGALLHSRMKAVAPEVFGVDIDAEALAVYRRLTRDDQNLIWDVQAALDSAAREQLCNPARRKFDLIVFSEVLEHLLNPGQALANLRAICAVHGCSACITVPNALSVVAFINALRGIETVHPLHYAYYSPYTLTKALQDSGFTSVDLAFYSSPDTLDTPGLTKHGLIAMATVESPTP